MCDSHDQSVCPVPVSFLQAHYEAGCEEPNRNPILSGETTDVMPDSSQRGHDREIESMQLLQSLWDSFTGCSLELVAYRQNLEEQVNHEGKQSLTF